MGRRGGVITHHFLTPEWTKTHTLHFIPHKNTLLHHCKAQMVNSFVNFNIVHSTNNVKGRHSVGKMLNFQVTI
jgi:hypothetical protein